MEIKHVEAAKVFYHSEVTTLDEINRVAEREIGGMYAEAEKLGIKEVAPMQFVYHGMETDPAAKFTLEIAMVVNEEKPYDGKYKFKDLEGFECVSEIHKGSILEMNKTYEMLVPQLVKTGKQMGSQSREVYHKYIDQQSADNITEIQIGIN